MGSVNEKNLVLTRAQGAVLSRDFPTAARLYKQLLKDDPSNIDYLKEIGAIYVKAGEDEKAVPYYEQIITFYPHYIDAMNSLGAIFRRLKRYEESIEILQRAADEGRQTASVNYNLGFTYKEMGNYDDAIDAFESVIGENPTDVLAHNHLGCIYLAQKNYQKSISAFKRGLQIDQNHPILNYNLACCYRDAKQYTDAIRYYEASLRVKPGWVDAIKDYSNLLIKCQKTKEASDLVKHSIELHPNDSKLLSILGKIYLEQYDYDSAAKIFKRANSVDDKDVTILSGLAEALEKSDKPIEALDAVCKAVEIAPEDKNVKKQYVHTLLSAEEYDSAQVNVQSLYSDNGQEDPQVLDLYGQYCICVDDEIKAGEYFDKIGQVNKLYKDHLLSAANRYSQKGNFSQAERFAKDFIAKNVQNPAGYNVLGQIYSKEGNMEGAIDSFTKSQTLKQPNVLAEKQISSLKKQIALRDEINNTPVENEVIEEDTISAEQFMPQPVMEEEKNDSFDFGSMGDNVPMGEALLEDENDFFDELDKELEEDGIEADIPDSSEENNSENSDAINEPDSFSDNKESGSSSDNSSGNSGTENSDPFGNDFAKSLSDDDSISPFQDFDKQEPKSTAEQLVPDADFSDDEDFDYSKPVAEAPVSAESSVDEPVENEVPSESAEDEINPFDMAGSGTSDDNYPYNNNGNSRNPYNDDFKTPDGYSDNNDSYSSGDNSDDYSESAAGLSQDSGLTSDSNTGNGYGDNSGYNDNSGYENNYKNPAETSKPDIPEDNFSADDMINGIDGSDNFDFNQFDNTPSYDSNNRNNNPYSGYSPQSMFAREMEQRARDAGREGAQYAMDTAINAQRMAQQLADDHKVLKDKLEALDNQYKENKEAFEKALSEVQEEHKSKNDAADNIISDNVSSEVMEGEKAIDDIVSTAEVPIDFDKPETVINPEEDTDFYDSGFGDYETDALNYEDDISPETEESFAFDDEMDLSNLNTDDMFVEAEKTEPVHEETIETMEGEIPEIDSTFGTETAAPDSACLVQPMESNLEANCEEEVLEEGEPEEKLSEEDSNEELDLFKKLRSLCDFVPDSERQTNNFDSMRARIEYIISKMSGKKGLLKVAEGYAPDDILEDCIMNSVTEGLDQELIIEVLGIMKNLAVYLEDQSIAKTLCIKADELLAKITAE